MKGYKTSKDYKKLLNYLKNGYLIFGIGYGKTVSMGFVKGDNIINTDRVSVYGHAWRGHYPTDYFINSCKGADLEYIVPQITEGKDEMFSRSRWKRVLSTGRRSLCS